MSIKKIQHFINVAELKNISHAASRLNMVQPALSQSIKRLEDEIGVKLFNRSRKGMELTQSGEIFLGYAYGIISQYNKAKESLAGSVVSPTGNVSVALTASVMKVLAAPIAREVRLNYPEISLNLEEGLAMNIRNGFDAGMFDIVISHLPFPESEIEAEPLIDEELYLVTADKNVHEIGKISLMDLEKFELILPRDRHGVAPEIEQIAKNKKVRIKKSRISGALNPTLQLIESGYGASILPWSAIHDLVLEGKLAAYKVEGFDFTHRICMNFPANRPLPPATFVVMNVIRSATRLATETGIWRGRLLV